MTKLVDWVAATAITAAIVRATPAVAFHGGDFEDGMRFGGRIDGMRMGQQVSTGGFHNPACFRHRRHFCDAVFVGAPFFYGYVPPYYDYVPYNGNYCWQQVWTTAGWQWVDACPGYHGYAY